VSRSCPSCGSSYPDETFFCGADGSITVQDQSANDFDPRLGKQLGGYVVVARVADGAMGRVYEGRHPETRARVAIKVLHAHVARDRVAVERFKREYEAAHEMDNPYVVDVLEFGETPDHSHFLTMEYLEGQELSKALAAKTPLVLQRVVRTVCQVALALEHAHSYGFIHRDLKPDNIFLCDTPNGTQVRVLDFGSVKLQVETGAKLTALGTTLGSPYYMSPEQATGASDVDQRSDVFALGAILYEMLTGKIAFGAANVALILMKILNQSPPPPSSANPACSIAIDAVVDRALRKDKQARYASARRLAEGLLAACGLPGTVESWAEKSESELDRALLTSRPPPLAADTMAAAATVSVPVNEPAMIAVAAAALAPAPPMQPSAALNLATVTTPSSAGKSIRVSEVSLAVPTYWTKAKLLVSIAIGLAVLGLIALFAF
jgi:serine/threonine protein kinase